MYVHTQAHTHTTCSWCDLCDALWFQRHSAFSSARPASKGEIQRLDLPDLTGKTTTIGKLSNYYIKKGYTPVIAASDTFRAGAIEQVQYHADNLGVKLIKHEKGSDPAAVAFDAVQHARAKGKELVLIDTAGRMQTNTNLMDEMKKIRRVSKPDLVVFVGDALTGNDATEQARKFNEAIDIDGVILTKADADSKGGAALSIGYIIQKPILFLGMGQSYDDIKEYDADWMLEQIFS